MLVLVIANVLFQLRAWPLPYWALIAETPNSLFTALFILLINLVLFFYICLMPISFSNDGSEFGGSIYQKVSDNLETAINLNWTAGTNNTRFGIAAKYQLDSTASVSVSRTL